MAGQRFTMTEGETVAFSGRIPSVNSSVQGEIRRPQTAIKEAAADRTTRSYAASEDEQRASLQSVAASFPFG